MKIVITMTIAILALGCDAMENPEQPEGGSGTACDSNRRECNEERTQTLKCEKGVWIVWDDCASPCKYKNGNAICGGGSGGDEEVGDGGCFPEPEPEPEPCDPEEGTPSEDPVEDTPIEEQCLRRTYIVEDPEDLNELKQYNCLIGQLLIQDTWLTEVDLSNLRTVYGDIRITGNSRLVEIDFSSLERVVPEPGPGEGGTLEIRINPELHTFHMALLSEVSSVRFDNSKVEKLSLSQLDVLHYLQVSGNRNLKEIDISNVKVMTVLELNSNPMLKGIPTQQFEYILEVYINDNSTLQYIDFPGVEQDRFGHMRVVGNASLREFSIPGLTEVQGEVDISENPSLTVVDLGRLEETKRSLRISGNVALKGVGLGRLEIVREKLEISQNSTIPYWEDGQNLISIASAAQALDLQSLVATSDLVVVDNRSLNCDPRAITSAVDVVGNTDIRGNARGCEL